MVVRAHRSAGSFSAILNARGDTVPTVTLKQQVAEHWMVSVLRASGLAGAESLECVSASPIVEVWQRAADACGLTEHELARHVARQLDLAVADLESADPAVVGRLPETLAHRHLVLPLRDEDRRVVVATCDPFDLETEQVVEFVTGKSLTFELSPPTLLNEAIHARYSPERLFDGLLDRADVRSDSVRFVEDRESEEITTEDAEAAPVVTLTNHILRDAVTQRASDIHIEPDGSNGIIRLRVDGMLQHYLTMPMPVLTRTISRLKILSKLDVAERHRPQDGRARIVVDGRRIDLRVATVPCGTAEKITIRLLDPNVFKSVGDLDMPTQETEGLHDLLGQREGLVVITGPTGSGKTTTLYARLRELATGKVNIMTVEDPVEYDLPGMTQIQFDLPRQVTFPSALRSILRHDPDIIFVGEIRDPETAAVAIQAGMTGHLVLTTMHTNSAAGVPARLVDLGVDRTAVAESFRGSMAQRLLRRVCPNCAEEVNDILLPEEELLAQTYGVKPVLRALGCHACRHTGYRGRLPVTETMLATVHIRHLIYSGAHSLQLERAATEDGMHTMRDVALDRVRGGETTLDEINRVLGVFGGDTDGGDDTDRSTPW